MLGVTAWQDGRSCQLGMLRCAKWQDLRGWEDYLTRTPVVEPPGQWSIALPAPEGRRTRVDLPPLRGWEDYLTRTPVVPPPANIRRPSGTEENHLARE